MLPARLHTNSRRQEAGKRSPAHRGWVRGHACSVPGCDGRPIECAHVRLGTDGGLGVKPSDRWCISLCKDHHARQHQVGEASFAREAGIDLVKLAREFFAKSPHRAKLEARQ
jgi:hypothetical protein